jgi:hypothetical protein
MIVAAIFPWLLVNPSSQYCWVSISKQSWPLFSKLLIYWRWYSHVLLVNPCSHDVSKTESAVTLSTELIKPRGKLRLQYEHLGFIVDISKVSGP